MVIIESTLEEGFTGVSSEHQFARHTWRQVKAQSVQHSVKESSACRSVMCVAGPGKMPLDTP